VPKAGLLRAVVTRSDWPVTRPQSTAMLAAFLPMLIHGIL